MFALVEFVTIFAVAKNYGEVAQPVRAQHS